MLAIQDHQLLSLAERRFELRLMDLLDAHDVGAKAELATADGRAALRHQIKRSRQYGMHSELDIARYVITAWQLGLDFDQRFAALAEILATDRLTPPQKSQALERVAVEVLSGLRAGQGRDA